MNKKTIILTSILLIILVSLTAFYNIHLTSKEDKRTKSGTYINENKNTTNQRLLKIKGKLYYDSASESEIKARCGVMDGKITSHIEENLIPIEDNQSNFPGDYEYQYGEYGTIDVVIDGKWITFKPLDSKIDFLDENFKIEVITNNSKDIKGKEYYKKEDNQTIYLVGLEELYLIDSNNKVTLKDYINQENISSNEAITYLKNKIKYVTSLYDGGTSIYSDTKLSNTGFKLIECHTLKGNTDVYIGLKSLNEEEAFEKGYCGK